ncbi:hypothetical protein BG004_006078 [Podila humilis]|nr:hypothetical protein BG004_006078 [Podila humilis]
MDKRTPLEIPEIVSRVGFFVPLWICALGNHEKVFCPADLISCLKVCRLWNTMMTPILWRTYCGHYCTRVSWTQVMANLQHFRFVNIAFPWEKDLPTNLTELILHDSAVLDSEQLIRANTRLRHIYVDLASDPESNSAFHALESLSELESLSASNVEFKDPGQLTRVLNHNPQLRRIELSFCDVLEPLTGCQTWENITFLQLEDNYDIHDFVQLVRNCPRLESIVFKASFSESALAFARNLREFCPDLHTICRKNFMDDRARNASRAEAAELEVVALIEASRRLVSLDLPIYKMTPRIYCRLLDLHEHFLTEINLRVSKITLDNLSGLKAIVNRCSNLVSLTVIQSYSTKYSTSMHIVKILDTEWCCPKLRNISLKRFTAEYELKEGLKPKEANPQYAKNRRQIQAGSGLPPRHPEEDRGFYAGIVRQGWRNIKYPQPSAWSDSIPPTLRDLRNLVFDRIGGLPSMKRIRLENLYYSREGRKDRIV